MLLAAAGIYVLTVYFTTDVVNCLGLQAAEPAEALLANEAGSNKRMAKMHGVDVEVQEIIHSRMADGRHAGSTTTWNMDVTAHGIIAEPAMDTGKRREAASKRGSIGLEFSTPDSNVGSVMKYKDLKEVVIMEGGTIMLEFYHNLQHVSLKLTVEDSDRRDELLRNIERFSLGRPWVHGYDATAMGAVKHLTHTLGSKDASIMAKVLTIPEFFIDVLLKGTLFAVDVKDIKKEGRWPLCFAGAMFWLAIFSFLMLEIAEQIHYNIPALPDSFLGITVCAIGTSFPNAVASILMAQQNKPAAAIANALGSNVQNVFLAMALPWVIYSAQNNFEPISQNVAGITEGVFWMMGTLILVVFFVLWPATCTLTKCNGIVLVSVYAAYLVITSGETFGWWPPILK